MLVLPGNQPACIFLIHRIEYRCQFLLDVMILAKTQLGWQLLIFFFFINWNIDININYKEIKECHALILLW